MALIRYYLLHPWRGLVAVVLGVLLGVGSFLTVSLWSAVDAIATEDFDPDSARAGIDATTPSVTGWEFVEPLPIPGDEDLLTLADLSTDYDLDAFDPRSFSPYAFGTPIGDGVFNSYLMVGTDASGARADAIILALQPSAGGNPIMVSIPRDLYVWNTCRSTFTRINEGLVGCSGAASSLELMAILVEDYTGVPIDHVVRINFDGFVSVVNALGGTRICVDNPTRDIKAHLDIGAGCQDADGATTLAWVRSRHMEQLIGEDWNAVGGSDFGRQRRQQDILFQLAGKASGFGSPTSLANALSAATSSVRVDSDWSFGSAVSAAWKYRGISQSSVARFAIGVRNYRTPKGAQVLMPTAYFADELRSVYPLG